MTDGRAAFAALFAHEQQQLAPREASPAQQWLHRDGISPAPLPEAQQRLFAARAAHSVVLLVPGMLGDCVAAQSVPFGDGVMRTAARSVTEAYQQYNDLGLHSIRMVPLPGRAPSANNGRLLAQAIRQAAAEPQVQRIVLVAYSKGTPDSLHALDELQRTGGLPAQLKALVSVAGVVLGTPVADRYQGLYAAFSPWLSPSDCSPDQPGDLESLTTAERTRWLAVHPLPRSLSYYSVVAHAPPQAMALPLRPLAFVLSDTDPRNDGQVPASHGVLPHSTLLAEAFADHWDVALPRNRHPSALARATTSGRDYPREALFRALVKTAISTGP